MPIPVIKATLTGLRYALRPLNNVLIRKLKASKKDSPMYSYFERFGQGTNRFEVNLNRILLG